MNLHTKGARILGLTLILLLLVVYAGQAAESPGVIYLPIAMGPSASSTEPPVNMPPPATSPDWLERLNYYRAMAGVLPVAEETVYSTDLLQHTQYMLENIPSGCDFLRHSEDPACPLYTTIGHQAATESNLVYGSQFEISESIDLWMGSPYHRYGMLHPQLAYTGFAHLCNSGNCAGGLNVLRGLRLVADPELYAGGIIYPGDGETNVLPEMPITWQFDAFNNPTVQLIAASVTDTEGKLLVIETEAPPAPGFYFNMIIIRVSEGYQPGKRYTTDVTIDLGGEVIQKSWSFTAGSEPLYLRSSKQIFQLSEPAAQLAHR
jgi:uncharacterized protein YkwD